MYNYVIVLLKYIDKYCWYLWDILGASERGFKKRTSTYFVVRKKKIYFKIKVYPTTFNIFIKELVDYMNKQFSTIRLSRKLAEKFSSMKHQIVAKASKQHSLAVS